MDAYIDTLYQQFLEDPQSVDPHWQGYFQAIEDFDLQPCTHPQGEETEAEVLGRLSSSAQRWHPTPQQGVGALIHAYRQEGHRYAATNPLYAQETDFRDIFLEKCGLSQTNPEEMLPTQGLLSEEKAPLKKIVNALEKTYTSAIGVQLADVRDAVERRWLQQKMEACQNSPTYTQDEKETLYTAVYRAHAFERFLHKKFMGVKRFSLEGGESLIPMLDQLVEAAGAARMSDIVFGMAHRGRLNVLSHILAQPLEEVLASFLGKLEHGETHSGDVKYHMGRSTDVPTQSGESLHVSLLSNPSHLEAVNPVVLGAARAKQGRKGKGIKTVLPVLIHGDAAFAGQGVVPETLNFANLKGYSVGGTLHIVLNNQIGFTATPKETASARYCTDIARMLGCPIMHVNGDDPEACVHALRLAFEYRQKFHKDVVIDVICYRRHGHNEGDDPTFTQPLLYARIENHPPVPQVYKQQLLAEKSVEEQKLKEIETVYADILNAAYAEAEQGVIATHDVFQDVWKGIEPEGKSTPETAISQNVLNEMALAMTTVPEDFRPHKKVMKLMIQRAEMLAGAEPLNWGAAETAAYGSLLKEGYAVRLSGQDVQRGTFSHRHSMIMDEALGQIYAPLSPLVQENASFEVYNSSLSEFGVLGFEFGYSLATPQGLTIWEAQFGDFANGGQVIIDQFIASSEQKWHRYSGLVLHLPHGMEGQGPEHSSARLERFLQLCAENNISVCTPTTPAQMFHLLRRQMHRTYRRPLIVMTPKSLLRHPAAISDIESLKNGHFYPVLHDAATASLKTQIMPRHAADMPQYAPLVLLCGGKVYYDLCAKKEALNRKDVAIIRIEELYPLPVKELKDILKTYENADIRWVQEEHRNQGAWRFLSDTLWPKLGISAPKYVGRPEASSPAVGLAKRHIEEQDKLLEEAFAA